MNKDYWLLLPWARQLKNVKDQRDRLNRENADLVEKLVQQENYYKLYVDENEQLTDKIDQLKGENEALQKHNEIMHEALDVAQAEVERLLQDHATIPPTRPTTKRVGAKKKEAENE